MAGEPKKGVDDLQDSEATAPQLPAPIASFIENNCYACHEGEFAEASFDLAGLSRDLSESRAIEDWAHALDRVASGEMPPEDFAAIPSKDRKAFVNATTTWLSNFQVSDFQRHGRVRGRRLTSTELERTLHDLLGIDIPLGRFLPTDEPQSGYSTFASNQATSHFHLARHLSAVDVALDEAFNRAFSDDDNPPRDLNAKKLARTRRRTREPELIDGRIVIWSSRLSFYGRIPATTAKEDGWYRFHIRGIEAINKPDGHGVWCSVRSGRCVSSAPLLAWVDGFEATGEPKDVTIEAWLPKGHMLEIRPGDATLKMARFKGGQAANGEGGAQNVPGIGIDSMTMQQIHRGPDNDQIRGWLFGDLKTKVAKSTASLDSNTPKKDARRLMNRFAHRAFRGPVEPKEIEPYVGLVTEQIDQGEPLVDALRLGYRALLCAPRFVYFTEQPGELDDHALASRLSYFLYGSMPDATLRQLADQGKLGDPQTLREQVDRILDSPKGQRFIRDFAAEWLDLDQIESTTPDRRMFPEFDPIVQDAMRDETHAYLQYLLDNDRDVGELIESDYTFLNSRLARFYDIDAAVGHQIEKCKLPASSRRGGLLTHGSIMKVTANGTTTSPVIRGVWISERLLGVEVPPPPENVPAIEPDIRGATSIRDMLAKHRSDPSCAACHVKIDPAGFALENFDPVGQWRDRYGRRGSKGVAIDASYELPDGREFADIEEFQGLVATNRKELAENVVRHLLAYGTGREVTFADRPVVQEIVESNSDHYGLRSLLKSVVTSDTFTNK